MLIFLPGKWPPIPQPWLVMASPWHQLDSSGPDLDVPCRVSCRLKVFWIIKGALWSLWHFPPLEAGWFGVFHSPHLIRIFDRIGRQSGSTHMSDAPCKPCACFLCSRARSSVKRSSLTLSKWEKSLLWPALTVMFFPVLSDGEHYLTPTHLIIVLHTKFLHESCNY